MGVGLAAHGGCGYRGTQHITRPHSIKIVHVPSLYH